MRVLALLLALVATCGGAEPKPLQIEIRSAQAWAQTPDASARALAVATAAARWWGGSISDLDGWTLMLEDPPLDSPEAGGVTVPARSAIEVSTAFGPCPEAAPIPHEIGHAILFVTSRDPDSGHHDPRWRLVRPAGAQFCNERPRADDLERHDSMIQLPTTCPTVLERFTRCNGSVLDVCAPGGRRAPSKTVFWAMATTSSITQCY